MSGFTFVEAQGGTAGYPPPAQSFTESVAVGDVLIAWLWLNGVSTDAGISVSDNVNSGGWTQFANTVDATTTRQIAIFYKVANASGTPTVTPALVTDYYGYMEIAHFTVPSGASVHADPQQVYTGSSGSANTSDLESVHDNTLMALMVQASSAYTPGYGWSGGTWSGTAQSASQPPLYGNVATAGTNNDVDVGLSGTSDWVSLVGLLYYTTGNPIEGTISASFGASATLIGAGLLAGSIGASFGQSGLAKGLGVLAGSIAATFGQSGTLAGAGLLEGTSGATFSQAGQISGVGKLLGFAGGVFSQSGSLAAGANIAGLAASVFGVTGAIEGITQNPPILEIDLVTWLRASTIAALVNNQIYGLLRPQGIRPLPEILIQRRATTRAQIFCGQDQLVSADIQIDVYASGAAQMLTTARDLRKVLIGYTGTMGNTYVDSVFLSNEFPIVDPEPGDYRMTQTYTFWYQED